MVIKKIHNKNLFSVSTTIATAALVLVASGCSLTRTPVNEPIVDGAANPGAHFVQQGLASWEREFGEEDTSELPITIQDMRASDVDPLIGNGITPDSLLGQVDYPSDLVETGWFEPTASSTLHWKSIFDDHRNYYQSHTFRSMLRPLIVAGTLANSSADQEIHDWYQEKIRNDATDDFSKVVKHFGEQWEVVPVYFGASIIGRMTDVPPSVQVWGDRSIRSMIVGVPPLLFAQKALGGSRPRDTPPSSNWHFWADDNGASGHAFVGAVPFLVAAQLTNIRAMRNSLLFASTFTGLSRINDNAHYTSQVIIGWYLAYMATQSVERTDSNNRYDIVPMIFDESLGVGVEFDY